MDAISKLEYLTIVTANEKAEHENPDCPCMRVMLKFDGYGFRCVGCGGYPDKKAK